MSEPRTVVGAIGLYPTPDALAEGLEQARQSGFTRLDVVSPYPLHGIDRLLGRGPSKLGYVALAAGLLGVTAAKSTQWWMSAVDYPLNIGGKPLFSWPAFVPVTFELMVLFASISTVVAMLAVCNGLPRYGSALLRSPLMRALTSDRFGLVLDARDPRFRPDTVAQDLKSLGAQQVDLLHQARSGGSHSDQVVSVRFLALLIVVAFVAAGATRFVWRYAGALPPYDFMKAQAKVVAQEELPGPGSSVAMQPPVPGTVARGLIPYPYAADPEAAGARLVNPLLPTAAEIEAGQRAFNTFCRHCHGPLAQGNGTLTAAFPKAPSLHSARARSWPDGRIYHVATVGQNAMPAHAPQVSRDDRWRIVLYVRALQRSLNAPQGDLP